MRNCHFLVLAMGIVAGLTQSVSAQQPQEAETLPPPRLAQPVPTQPQVAPESTVVPQPTIIPQPLGVYGPSQSYLGQKMLYGPAVHQPRITYRQHHRCRRRCGCAHAPPVKVVMAVMNPVTCCIVHVPVCLPSCCMGAPAKSARPALFGRGIVNYHWPSGFRMKIIFDRQGDAVVHYFGA